MTTQILGVDAGTVFTGFGRLVMAGRVLQPVDAARDFWVEKAGSLDEMIARVSLVVRDFLKQEGQGRLVVALEASFPPAAAKVRVPNWGLTEQVRGAVKTAVALFGPAETVEMTAAQIRAGLGLPGLPRGRKITGTKRRSEDRRVREQFCLLTGLSVELFRGRDSSHRVDAGAAALVTAWRHCRAENERLVV